MMRLRSVFLTSENPEVAARFYAQVAQLPMEKVGVEGGSFTGGWIGMACNWRFTTPRRLPITLIPRCPTQI